MASTVESLLAQYSSDHVNPTNQVIHLFCVPAIVWSASAMLWAIPVPGDFLKAGSWCALVMFLAWLWYWSKSRSLAVGALVGFVLMIFLNRWLVFRLGINGLLALGVGVFVVAWIAQFIGHKIEGKRPSFLTDLVYLLVGPLWTLNKLYRKVGLV